MSSAPVLQNDELRVARIRSYDVLDAVPSDAFASVARLVAAVCDTPMALVTMLDEAREIFVSHIGIEAASVPRDTSFGRHALAHPADLLIVPDARNDARFRDNPLITAAPCVRFYAAAPLVTADGIALGTVGVLDVVPRTLAEAGRTTLQLAARCVIALLEERRTSLRLAASLTEQRTKAARLALLESLAGNADDGVLVLETSARSGGLPTVLFANTSVTRLTGWSPDDLPQPVDAGLWGALAERDGLPALDAMLRGIQPYATEARVRLGDRRATLLEIQFAPLVEPAAEASARWIVRISDRRDRQHAAAVERRAETILVRNSELAADIERRRGVERRLTFAAAHDSLTGLPNRIYFIDRLRARFISARTRPNDVPFAVMFLDVDRFKAVNDTLGHLLGDELLTTIGRRLAACVRVQDVVARLGGDEFTILVDAAGDRRTIANLAERIGRAVATPCLIGRNGVNVSASIGVVIDDGSHASAEELLRDADIAMFHAKASGRNRYEFYRADMGARVIGEARIENALRIALQRSEFRLVYQPIVALADPTRTALGFEALLRWDSPHQSRLGTRGIVTAAEENGSIVPIGDWVIGEACRQLALWKATLPASERTPFVTVNVSPRQLLERDFAAKVERTLLGAGVAPSDLALELTESVLMHEAELIVETLARLRDVGVQLYLDDFGTGYASLGYLRRFAVDWLKIDRSFVGGRSDGLADEGIVDGIVSFAHRLGIKTVAEGVETGAQIERLIALGCECAQGYAYSEPVDTAGATQMLTLSPRATRAAT